MTREISAAPAPIVPATNGADMSDPFLQYFEETRLSIEKEMLLTPESSKLLTDYQSFANTPKYLHAIPIICTSLKILANTPRTYKRVCDLYARSGSPLSVNKKLGHVIMCFGLASIYRTVAKKTDLPEFAQLFIKIACLSSMNYDALEQIDWVVKANARARHGSGEDWLAPALLFTVWTTNLESPAKARQIAGMLDELSSFMSNTLDFALNNQIYMQFPW